MTADDCETVNDAEYHLLFGVRRSIRYHTHRSDFFDRIGLWKNVLSLASGSSSLVALLRTLGDGTSTGIALALAATVTVISVVDLVIGSARKASVHRSLARRFLALEKQIVLTTTATVDDLARFTAARLEIEADEPAVLRILDILCHNEQAIADGRPEAVRPLRWHQRALAQLVRFDVSQLTATGTKDRIKGSS